MIRSSRILLTATVATFGIVVAYTCVLITRPDVVNHVSGVWLVLARDTREGVLYRALIDSGQYGGTRYFPLLFVSIATLMRAGAAPLLAGQIVSVGGAVLLAMAAWGFLRALGLAARDACAGAVLAVAPYFIVESAVAIRVEPLAMALVLTGCAVVVRRIDAGQGSLPGAALLLTLAVAAKPTAIYGGVAAILALACAGRWRDAARLMLLFTLSCAVLVFTIEVASDGRALESFRACALAGGSLAGLFSAAGLGLNVSRITDSHVLTAVLGGAVLAALARPRRICTVPGTLLVGAMSALFVALATPGTIVTNQGIEPYVAAVLFMVWLTSGSGRRGSLRAYALAGLLVWVASQDVRHMRASLARPVAASEDARAESAAIVAECADPILAESPLVPLLARRRAVLLDPFAFRVAALNRPDIAADLETRLDRREFACVILEHDPLTAAGAAWYEHVHLGRPTLDAILQNYTLGDIRGRHRVYVPRGSLAASSSLPGTGLSGPRSSVSGRTNPP